MNRMSGRETVVELPFTADCSPCVEKLRTVLPFTVGIRDGVVHLVSTLGSAVSSALRGKGGVEERERELAGLWVANEASALIALESTEATLSRTPPTHRPG
jgi:hypothetical protein